MKRCFDLVVSTSLLVLGLPLLAVIALLIRARLGSPMLFRQVRPGRGGALFGMLKFRTMTDRRDQAGNLLPDQDRLTPLGTFLRHSSLDELPELWNVFRGQMSLVGPRPLLPEYLDQYTPQQARRHDVLPGITGWAQVNGRNAISWDRKFELDVWYVDHQSLRLDLKILWLTLFRVIRSDGIRSPGHATMPPFQRTPTAVRHAGGSINAYQVAADGDGRSRAA